MVEPTRVLVRHIGAVAWLVTASGRNAGHDKRLSRLTTIGRDSSNDLVLNDSSASSSHAKIRLERGRFVLYDLGSTNGTTVNGERTQKQMLADGDVIVFSRAVYIFKEIRQ